MPQTYVKRDKILSSHSKDKHSSHSSSHTIDYSMHLNNKLRLLHFNKHRWSEIVTKHLRCHTSLSFLLHFCFGKRKFLISVLNPSFCLFLLFFKASAVLLTLILFFERFNGSSERVLIDVHLLNAYLSSWFICLTSEIAIYFIKNGHRLGWDNFSKYWMFIIEIRCFLHSDEKLTSIGHRSRIGHTHNTWLAVS